MNLTNWTSQLMEIFNSDLMDVSRSHPEIASVEFFLIRHPHIGIFLGVVLVPLLFGAFVLGVSGGQRHNGMFPGAGEANNNRNRRDVLEQEELLRRRRLLARQQQRQFGRQRVPWGLFALAALAAHLLFQKDEGQLVELSDRFHNGSINFHRDVHWASLVDDASNTPRHRRTVSHHPTPPILSPFIAAGSERFGAFAVEDVFNPEGDFPIEGVSAGALEWAADAWEKHALAQRAVDHLLSLRDGTSTAYASATTTQEVGSSPGAPLDAAARQPHQQQQQQQQQRRQRQRMRALDNEVEELRRREATTKRVRGTMGTLTGPEGAALRRTGLRPELWCDAPVPIKQSGSPPWEPGKVGGVALEFIDDHGDFSFSSFSSSSSSTPTKSTHAKRRAKSMRRAHHGGRALFEAGGEDDEEEEHAWANARVKVPWGRASRGARGGGGAADLDRQRKGHLKRWSVHGVNATASATYKRRAGDGGGHVFRLDLRIMNSGPLTVQVVTAERRIVGDSWPHPSDHRHPRSQQYQRGLARGSFRKPSKREVDVQRGRPHMQFSVSDLPAWLFGDHRKSDSVKESIDWRPSFVYSSLEPAGLGALKDSILAPFDGETSMSFLASLPLPRSTFHGSFQFQVLAEDALSAKRRRAFLAAAFRRADRQARALLAERNSTRAKETTLSATTTTTRAVPARDDDDDADSREGVGHGQPVRVEHAASAESPLPSTPISASSTRHGGSEVASVEEVAVAAVRQASAVRAATELFSTLAASAEREAQERWPQVGSWFSVPVDRIALVENGHHHYDPIYGYCSDKDYRAPYSLNFDEDDEEEGDDRAGDYFENNRALPIPLLPPSLAVPPPPPPPVPPLPREGAEAKTCDSGEDVSSLGPTSSSVTTPSTGATSTSSGSSSSSNSALVKGESGGSGGIRGGDNEPEDHVGASESSGLPKGVRGFGSAEDSEAAQSVQRRDEGSRSAAGGEDDDLESVSVTEEEKIVQKKEKEDDEWEAKGEKEEEENGVVGGSDGGEDDEEDDNDDDDDDDEDEEEEEDDEGGSSWADESAVSVAVTGRVVVGMRLHYVGVETEELLIFDDDDDDDDDDGPEPGDQKEGQSNGDGSKVHESSETSNDDNDDNGTDDSSHTGQQQQQQQGRSSLIPAAVSRRWVQVMGALLGDSPPTARLEGSGRDGGSNHRAERGRRSSKEEEEESEADRVSHKKNGTEPGRKASKASKGKRERSSGHSGALARGASSLAVAKRAAVCEGTCHTLQCARGDENLVVVQASVGRTSREVCQHAAMSRVDCERDVTSAVRSVCSKQASEQRKGASQFESGGKEPLKCEVCEGRDGVGGDPLFCENTFKYVNITYACVRPGQALPVGIGGASGFPSSSSPQSFRVKTRRRYKFSYSAQIQNLRTTSVAITAHELFFAPSSSSSARVKNLKNQKKRKQSSEAGVVASAGIGVGGDSHNVGGHLDLGHSDANEVAVLAANHEYDSVLRIQGELLLPSRFGRLTGHYTVASFHPLLAGLAPFFPQALTPGARVTHEKLPGDENGNEDDEGRHRLLRKEFTLRPANNLDTTAFYAAEHGEPRVVGGLVEETEADEAESAVHKIIGAPSRYADFRTWLQEIWRGLARGDEFDAAIAPLREKKMSNIQAAASS